MAEQGMSNRAALQESQQALRETQDRLAAMENSLSWRVTKPVRAVLHRIPRRIKRRARQGAKLAWWLATPHKIPLRLRLLRDRRKYEALLDITETHELNSSGNRAEPAADSSVEAMRDLIANSKFFNAEWYLEQYPQVAKAGIDPALHYTLYGFGEGRDPSEFFSTRAYLQIYADVAKAGINPLVHYIQHGEKEGRFIADSHLTQGNAVTDIIRQRYRELAPLPIYRLEKDHGPRITLLTDSISAGSFYGGVGTATILAALLARRMNATLRIVTLREEPSPESVGRLLEINGTQWNENIEFKFLNIMSKYTPSLDVGPNDLFITTSWWSTTNALGSLDPEKIIYILQEDERMFYAGGDQRLRCHEILSNKKLRYVVNTEILYDFLVSSGLDNLRSQGRWFEPAFTESLYYFENKPREKLNFFFYARPWTDRNLYYRGLEVIDEALSKRILNPNDWSLYFVGKDIVDVTLPFAVKPHVMQNLQWGDYACLMRQMDLGLSLMYTPHPSYPPLDLAACGAVAVTNRFGPKKSLQKYSENIICADLSVSDLLQGLEEGVLLAKNNSLRKRNYDSQKLNRSWEDAFQNVLSWLA